MQTETNQMTSRSVPECSQICSRRSTIILLLKKISPNKSKITQSYLDNQVNTKELIRLMEYELPKVKRQMFKEDENIEMQQIDEESDDDQSNSHSILDEENKHQRI